MLPNCANGHPITSEYYYSDVPEIVQIGRIVTLIHWYDHRIFLARDTSNGRVNKYRWSDVLFLIQRGGIVIRMY